MRARRLLLCTLAACTVAKGDTGDGGDTTFGDEAGFTSTLGMSSDPSAPTVPPTSDPGTTADAEGTGTITAGPTTVPPGDDLPPGDSSGPYLLAIATTIAPDLPFQFLATVDASDPALWDLSLQPLSLDVGQTDGPQQPVGVPLVFTDVPVVDGKFTLELGDNTMLPGATNPVTGSDIAATLTLDATVIDADFFCGDVGGMVTAPLMTSIDGSTFAAVRVAGLDQLPAEITINCAGDTVSS